MTLLRNAQLYFAFNLDGMALEKIGPKFTISHGIQRCWREDRMPIVQPHLTETSLRRDDDPHAAPTRNTGVPRNV